MKAKWIWTHGKEIAYNETIIARRSLRLGEVKSATVKIVADSYYRLTINGQWVGDGPCRSWPEHLHYDVIDVGAYLCKGTNEIQIIARHFGIGDLHGVYQRPGLLMEMDVRLASGKRKKIVTDRNWETAIAKQWISETPKIAIQMEPAEMYDARLEGKGRFGKAVEICDANKGPWKDLTPRDVALLTRKPFGVKRFVKANQVRTKGESFCVPAVKLCNPGIVPKANGNAGAACGMATEIVVKNKTVLEFEKLNWSIAVDGKTNKRNRFVLSPGRHLILVVSEQAACMHQLDKVLTLQTDGDYKLRNPIKAGFENPWVWIRFKEFHFYKDDMYFIFAPEREPEIEEIESRYAAYKNGLLKKVKDAASLKNELGSKMKLMKSGKMFVHDTVWAFQHREVIDEYTKVENASAVISDNAAVTIVPAAKDGDVELIYDLGEQNLGYWSIDLQAPAGVTVDLFAVEHIFSDGRPQHTLLNRNGFRYITKEGRNQFTTLKIRSGRYLYLTLRNAKQPVRIRHIGILESTYPVDYKAQFKCSDPQMEKIWEISERTVKLCMTDTYLDCPLYEQTFWVGDARNESLFGYLLFGAEDIAKRCVRIAGESLEHYPMVGCQVPSSWDCLLSAWSFLWGLSVWEYYWYTGEKQFLKDYWPMVEKNLEGAFGYIDENGLFTAPFWNMFDWSDIDQMQNTVLHNSMLLVGAIDAAVRCAEVLGKQKQVQKLKKQSKKLAKAVNRFWDEKKKSYPDSIYTDGTISSSICQHTSFLSLLYDIAPPRFADDCLRNTLRPRKDMITVGSPFAIFYLFECWEKLGLYDEIFKSIRENYIPMLEADATTVWEGFPNNNFPDEVTDGGPTRSHCHAWSSAPVYFIARGTLGVKQTQPGGLAFEISPWINGLDWARGTVMSKQGQIHVSWKREGKTLEVNYRGPNGVKLKFAKNDSHKGLKVKLNKQNQS